MKRELEEKMKADRESRAEWAGCRRLYLEEVDSTNEEIRRQAAQGACHGTLAVAGKQTAGRGRRGRNWFSPEDGSIYMSLLLRPSFPPDRASMLTLVMALAVCRAIHRVCGLEAFIKWPNDILVNQKKVCGILTELQLKEGEIDFIVIGIGINLSQKEFPGEFSENATSLFLETGRAVAKEELVNQVMAEFEECYESFLQSRDMSLLKQEYDNLLINRGRQVLVIGLQGEWTGEALGIDDAGELLVRRGQGKIERVFAGEVSVRGIYGYV